MHKVIISDTSCFIILSKVNELNLLEKLYGQIVTTFEVAEEFGEQLPEWVLIEYVKDKSKQNILELQIDKGESSAISFVFTHSLLTSYFLNTPSSTLTSFCQKLGLCFVGRHSWIDT